MLQKYACLRAFHANVFYSLLFIGYVMVRHYFITCMQLLETYVSILGNYWKLLENYVLLLFIVSSLTGETQALIIGNVFADDADDWDIADKNFFFFKKYPKKFFRLVRFWFCIQYHS